MNERINITPKDLHIQLKRGRDARFLQEKYRLPDEEALFEAIRRVTPGNADSFIRELQKRGKKHPKVDRASETDEQEPSVTEVSTTGISEPEAVEADSTEIEVPESDDTTETRVTTATIETTENPELKKLQDEEAELSKWLCKLETEHKALVQERAKIFDSLRESKENCEALLRRVSEIKSQVEDFRLKYEDISQEMAKYNGDISVAREILDDIRGKISLLKVTSIFIYEDGRIELEGGEEPDISEEDANHLFDVLTKRQDAEEFTVRELKSLARVVLVVRKYQKIGAKFELYFDSSKLQNYYDTVAGDLPH